MDVNNSCISCLLAVKVISNGLHAPHKALLILASLNNTPLGINTHFNVPQTNNDWNPKLEGGSVLVTVHFCFNHFLKCLVLLCYLLEMKIILQQLLITWWPAEYGDFRFIVHSVLFFLINLGFFQRSLCHVYNPMINNNFIFLHK